MPLRHLFGGNRGQSLVEAAISLPFLLILALGTVDVARAFYYREAVLNAARQALRESVSATQQSTANTACASGGTLTTTLPASGGSLSGIASAAALESTNNGTAQGTVISGATITVTWHCSGSTALTNTSATSTDPTNAGSDAVEVRVSWTMPLITPFTANLLGRNGFPIVADVIGRAEY